MAQRSAKPSFRIFFLLALSNPVDLHSFPTRRSSDLDQDETAGHREPVLAQLTPRELKRRFGGRVVSCARTGSDRKSTRLNSSHRTISCAIFCLKKKRLSLATICLLCFHCSVFSFR